MTIGPLLENCCNPCCGDGGCNNKWTMNIVSANPDCLRVDTSECWTVKLEPVCPPVVVAWDNITVDVENCEEDESCSLKYIVNADCKDEKVKACDWDTTPGTLMDKLVAWTGISIDPVWCDWSTNSKLVISASWGSPSPGGIPNITIIDRSSLIDASVSWTNWHTITLTDADGAFRYAKLVLAEWYDWIENSMGRDTTKSFALWWSWTSAVWQEVYNKNLIVNNWTIKITKSWLYHVGFSGSAECWSWIHAFRVQVYSTAEESSDNYTIIESRYSAPIWDQPYEVPGFWGISGFNIDAPLWWPATDIEWTQREANGKSASLWSYVSRMPVWWNTIVELKTGDIICVWVKISSEVRYTGDLLWDMDDYTPHFALLCKNSSRSWWVNTWPECGLSFYVDMIHPLNN